MPFYSKVKILKDDKSVQKLYLVTFLTYFIMIIILTLKWSVLPPEIPLFYSLPWGQDQLAQNWQILLLPLGSLAIIFINTFLSLFFVGKETLMVRILIGTSTFVCILTAITLFKIVFLASL